MTEPWTPTFALGGRTNLDPLEWYRTPKGWARPAPTHCRNGHEFGPNRVTVSAVVCIAVGGGHQTYFCRAEGCGEIIYVPKKAAGCNH